MDPTIKAELHLKYKNHRNVISTLKKKQKKLLKNYFKSNLNNSKDTWKGIKSIVTMKNVISTVRRALSHGDNTITNIVKLPTYLKTILPQLLML